MAYCILSGKMGLPDTYLGLGLKKKTKAGVIVDAELDEDGCIVKLDTEKADEVIVELILACFKV